MHVAKGAGNHTSRFFALLFYETLFKMCSAFLHLVLRTASHGEAPPSDVDFAEKLALVTYRLQEL